MTLETIEAPATNSNGQPPLLFVHGAWHGAWCWQRWMPYFADLGYDCWALSLRGHGESPDDRMGLRGPTLQDYVADVASVAATLPAPPIILGHSMGGAVTQLYLAKSDDDHPVAGAVLLASVPPRGAIGVTLKLLRTEPGVMARVMAGRNMEILVSDKDRANELFLSATADEETRSLLNSELGPESYRAFVDMLALQLPKPAKARKRPVMVLGAADDSIFTPKEIASTASGYDTEPVMISDLAHDVMLDTRWETAAAAVADWLGELPQSVDPR